MGDWYPPPNHPRQDTDRIIFDNLYQLRDQQNAQNSSSPAQVGGISQTINFPAPGFMAGNKTFHSLTFADGRLVSMK